MGKKQNIKVYPNQSIGTTVDKSRIEQTAAYNFVGFSEIPEYRTVNKELLLTAVKFLPANLKHIVHVDNATGTGLVPQLAIELYRDLGIKATIFGIDPDLYALQQAADSLPDVENIQVLLFQGYGQNLQELLKGHIPDVGVDLVSIHDAIHEIPGLDIKRAIFASQAKILRPGGVQTYNSAFTTVGMGESALKYGRWKLDAFSYFKQNRNKNVTAIEWYRPDEYAQMIKDSGLTIIHERIRTVMISRKALEAISQYPEFVNGVFRDMDHVGDYTLAEKSKALIAALDEQGITTLPRQWHEIVAQKSK
jgi:ubiquinone/menaquinone biosynthesis C-methylase UbiE